MPTIVRKYLLPFQSVQKHVDMLYVYNINYYIFSNFTLLVKSSFGFHHCFPKVHCTNPISFLFHCMPRVECSKALVPPFCVTKIIDMRKHLKRRNLVF